MQAACFPQSVNGPQVEIYRPDSTICCRKYLTLSETLFLSDLSWLSYKLLFVRPKLHYPRWKTISWKELSPWGRSVLTTDWQRSLSLFVSIPLSPFFYHFNPLLCSLFRSNCSCKHLWFSINFRNSTHCCMPVCQSSEHPLLEGNRSSIHQRHTDGIHHLQTSRNNNTPGPLPSLLPLNTILSILYFQLGWKQQLKSKASAISVCIMRGIHPCVFSMYSLITACDMKLQQCPALSAQWSHLSCSLIRCHVKSTVALDALDRPVHAGQLYQIACWNQSGSNAKQASKQAHPDETQKALRI